MGGMLLRACAVTAVSTAASSSLAAHCPQPFFSPALLAGYLLGPILGKGGFCSVRKALHELTGQAVACKIIEKGKLKVRPERSRTWPCPLLCPKLTAAAAQPLPSPSSPPSSLPSPSSSPLLLFFHRTPRTGTAWTASAA